MKLPTPSKKTTHRGIAAKEPFSTEVALRRSALLVLVLVGIAVTVWFFMELFALIF